MMDPAKYELLKEFLDVYIGSTIQLVESVEEIHWDRNGYCNECGGGFPCTTIQAVNAHREAVDFCDVILSA